jgi:DNA-directed RNA polymerase subunit RPC12/RpoP
MDEYCNEITYAKKWQTKENNRKVAALLKKYNTPYWSDCPCSWVNEIKDLLDTVNKKYGIKKNDSGLVKGFAVKTTGKGKKFLEKNAAYNKKYKPKVSLEQFKEKYGSLRFYFSCNDNEIEKDINKLVDSTQNKIIRKLKYPYPIYTCINCSQEQSWYTEDKKGKKICRYCESLLKDVKKSTKTSSKTPERDKKV